MLEGLKLKQRWLQRNDGWNSNNGSHPIGISCGDKERCLNYSGASERQISKTICDCMGSKHFFLVLHPGKQTWQWKTNHLKMHLLFKMVMFHCHVSFLRGILLFLVAACLINHGSFLQDMPSVERFDDTDFQALSRKIIESTAECAICLAALEVGEDGGKSVDLERCSKKTLWIWRIDVLHTRTSDPFVIYTLYTIFYCVCVCLLFLFFICYVLMIYFDFFK